MLNSIIVSAILLIDNYLLSASVFGGLYVLRDQYTEVANKAKENYAQSTPWPENDEWHKYTYLHEKAIVEKWLKQLAFTDTILLNAGSGGTIYRTEGQIIHLDIIEEYIKSFDRYIVGSVEKIDLPDCSVDGIICVGSVLNYADVQKAIGEFSRILRKNGFLIMEFERSDSAEFLFKKEHHNYVFCKEYIYNGHNHLLWMYSERHIRQILNQCGLKIKKCERVHCFSTLLNRFGLSEQKAARFCCFDSILQPLSYSLAHNALMLVRKKISSE